MDPASLLIIVAILALLIIVGTIVAVIIVSRRSTNKQTHSSTKADTPIPDLDLAGDTPASLAETIPVAASEDFESYLAEQQANLSTFELTDISNSFKGVTQEDERSGIVLHISDADSALIAFTSQAFSPQNGVVKAETAYGSMELIITQGRAGVKWEGSPLGILDYTNQNETELKPSNNQKINEKNYAFFIGSTDRRYILRTVEI